MLILIFKKIKKKWTYYKLKLLKLKMIIKSGTVDTAVFRNIIDGDFIDRLLQEKVF